MRIGVLESDNGAMLVGVAEMIAAFILNANAMKTTLGHAKAGRFLRNPRTANFRSLDIVTQYPQRGPTIGIALVAREAGVVNAGRSPNARRAMGQAALVPRPMP
jgi:hypothetical protein